MILQPLAAEMRKMQKNWLRRTACMKVQDSPCDKRLYIRVVVFLWRKIPAWHGWVDHRGEAPEHLDNCSQWEISIDSDLCWLFYRKKRIQTILFCQNFFKLQWATTEPNARCPLQSEVKIFPRPGKWLSFLLRTKWKCFIICQQGMHTKSFQRDRLIWQSLKWLFQALSSLNQILLENLNRQQEPETALAGSQERKWSEPRRDQRG